MLQPCHEPWQKYLQADHKARGQLYAQDISPSASPSPSHTYYSRGKDSDTDQVQRESLGSQGGQRAGLVGFLYERPGWGEAQGDLVLPVAQPQPSQITASCSAWSPRATDLNSQPHHQATLGRAVDPYASESQRWLTRPEGRDGP